MTQLAIAPYRRCAHPGCRGYAARGGLCPAHKRMVARLEANEPTVTAQRRKAAWALGVAQRRMA